MIAVIPVQARDMFWMIAMILGCPTSVGPGHTPHTRFACARPFRLAKGAGLTCPSSLGSRLRGNDGGGRGNDGYEPPASFATLHSRPPFASLRYAKGEG